jgi:hypothetical protein
VERKSTLTPPPKFRPTFTKPRIKIEFGGLAVNGTSVAAMKLMVLQLDFVKLFIVVNGGVGSA